LAIQSILFIATHVPPRMSGMDCRDAIGIALQIPIPTARTTHHFLIEIGIVSIKLSWPRSRGGSSRLFIPRRGL
jgi:hypothetical protein